MINQLSGKTSAVSTPKSLFPKRTPSRLSRLRTSKRTKSVRKVQGSWLWYVYKSLQIAGMFRIIITPPRSAQPSHIWKEAATQRRARERDLLLWPLSQVPGRLNTSSHPFGEQDQPLLSITSYRAQGIVCKARVYPLVQIEWHFSQYHLCFSLLR